MKRYGDIVKGADGLSEVVVENLKGIETQVANLLGVAKDTSKSEDERFEAISTILDRVRSAYSSALYNDEVIFPEFLISKTVSGDFTTVTVTVKSKLRAWYQTSEKRTVNVDENIIVNLKGLFDEVLYDMYYAEEAREGVDILNTNLAKIKEEAGLKFDVKFVITSDDATVPYIDDNSILIKVDIDEALNLYSYSLAYEEPEVEEEEDDSYQKLLFEEAKKAYIDVMQTIQITPEILKKHIDFIEKLGNLKTRKLSYKLIREGYKRQAIHLNPTKGEVGYFYDSDKDVFALLTRDEKGFSYVLKPFDTKSNTLSDYDVISEVEKNAKQF